ncbi:hypothetical protein GGI07_001159 [Coemansia sp. Benny D115]|nr:hypothetical protein GGI07_001159 [Coemansia sp. Benny D115]
MSCSPEHTLRNLDAILQDWAQVHRQSTAAASTLGSLLDQAAKTHAVQPTNTLLLAAQHAQAEECMRDIHSHARLYAGVVRRLDALAEQLDLAEEEGLSAVAGIDAPFVAATVCACREEYAREYLRRRGLLEATAWDCQPGGAWERLVAEWVDCKVNYSWEEEYLDRLRILRLARQWQANKTANEQPGLLLN